MHGRGAESGVAAEGAADQAAEVGQILVGETARAGRQAGEDHQTIAGKGSPEAQRDHSHEMRPTARRRPHQAPGPPAVSYGHHPREGRRDGGEGRA
jgi:hypothetical protein